MKQHKRQHMNIGISWVRKYILFLEHIIIRKSENRGIIFNI